MLGILDWNKGCKLALPWASIILTNMFYLTRKMFFKKLWANISMFVYCVFKHTSFYHLLEHWGSDNTRRSFYSPEQKWAAVSSSSQAPVLPIASSGWCSPVPRGFRVCDPWFKVKQYNATGQKNFVSEGRVAKIKEQEANVPQPKDVAGVECPILSS